MEEEVYQMTFDMHEDGETFYNTYAKVNSFSIRNYNMHKHNAITFERSFGKYLVNNFVSVHNHPMIGPCGVPFLRSHRKVSSSDKALVNTMHKVGIKTSHIMDFASQQSGGYEYVKFTQKDLYNYFTAQRNIEVSDGDAEGVLAYLCAKAKNVPLFYYKYDMDE
ncbi:hypothetical protein RHMOL_Rhmol04G0147800 [Rhododendron molle]|uniref:Uncharacterized protein n=1 Tax=Rhododendron molle TaxID=49168 RepID=A0ACC0P2V8_RHOML|nr:hypothetical protein RHMOL_Rhmol04G0147800 [Rhododendron molle]